jgi:hypothetical protein
MPDLTLRSLPPLAGSRPQATESTPEVHVGVVGTKVCPNAPLSRRGSLDNLRLLYEGIRSTQPICLWSSPSTIAS